MLKVVFSVSCKGLKVGKVAEISTLLKKNGKCPILAALTRVKAGPLGLRPSPPSPAAPPPPKRKTVKDAPKARNGKDLRLILRQKQRNLEGANADSVKAVKTDHATRLCAILNRWSTSHPFGAVERQLRTWGLRPPGPPPRNVEISDNRISLKIRL